jgi:hypothetical protein
MRAIPKFIGEIIVSVVISIIEKVATLIVKNKSKKTI